MARGFYPPEVDEAAARVQLTQDHAELRVAAIARAPYASHFGRAGRGPSTPAAGSAFSIDGAERIARASSK